MIDSSLRVALSYTPGNPSNRSGNQSDAGGLRQVGKVKLRADYGFDGLPFIGHKDTSDQLDKHETGDGTICPRHSYLRNQYHQITDSHYEPVQ